MDTKNEFVSYLEEISEDRQKMAALRRGLGLPPGTCAAMYPIVVTRLPRDCPREIEELYYLIAALYSLHPSSSYQGNLGDHMRQAIGDQSSDAVERRFTRLLSTHWDDLPNELRQTISFLKSKEEKVNWHQLITDLKFWKHHDHFVQRRWANAFWGYRVSEETK